jgi:hypothetical protein
MTQAWWGVGAHGDTLGALLVELGALDDVLDHLLLIPPLLVVAPPHWSLVFALETKMFAGAAGRLAFIALLPS